MALRNLRSRSLSLKAAPPNLKISSFKCRFPPAYSACSVLPAPPRVAASWHSWGQQLFKECPLCTKQGYGSFRRGHRHKCQGVLSTAGEPSGPSPIGVELAQPPWIQDNIISLDTFSCFPENPGILNFHVNCYNRRI